ncbi:MAG: hypothetical protein C0454_12220 [Parvibaculum sp.]|nr:hypothetical protein [Parvibaculum sp.]
MDSTHSPRAKRVTFSQPRPLTQSEIGSLRQDAISTATQVKKAIAQRKKQQQKSMTKLMAERMSLAAE